MTSSLSKECVNESCVMCPAYVVPSILDIRYWTFNPWFVIRLPGMRRKVSIEFVGPVVIIEPLTKPQRIKKKDSDYINKCKKKGCIMNEKEKCLRCGSTNTKPGNLQSTGKIYIRPKDAKLSAVLKSGVPVDAVICFDCGHIELIINPAEAKKLVKNS